MIIPMSRLVAEYGVRPKGVLHVGAHLGEEAGAYAEAGVERVLWVEANPELVGELRARILPYPGQYAVQAAVSDVDGGEATLYLATFTMSSSLLPPKDHLAVYPGIHYPRALGVVTTTVDTLLLEADLGSPGDFDLLNLDLEGAELLALRGAEGLLPHLKWVYLEVYHREMYEGCGLLPEVDAFLWARGFGRVAMADEGWDHGFSDALYARRPPA